MGCSVSRCCSPPDRKHQALVGKQSEEKKEEDEDEGETKAFLQDLKEERCPEPVCAEEAPHTATATATATTDASRPLVSKAILDLAQKMSEDIVAQALQLCWQVEVVYRELPYIDQELDYHI